MSMLEVWFLFVFLPNLGYPIGFTLFISIISLISGLVIIANQFIEYEDVSKLEQRYKGDLENPSVIGWVRDAQTNNVRRDLWKAIGLKIVYISITVGFLMGFLKAAVPDKKEVAAIVLVPYISNNPEFQKLPENLAKRLNDLLKEYVPAETKEEKADDAGQ